MPTIKTATESDEARVIDVLVLAFLTDPGARWTWPDPYQYLMHFREFVKAFGGKAFAHKSAFYVEGYAGSSLWLPPNVHPNEDAMTALLQRTASEQIQNDLERVFERMGSYHPKEPHWYLPLIGVDPFFQGNGFGSALLKHALVLCDRDNKSAFLESTNSRNVPLYERHGFKLLGKIQVGTFSHDFSHASETARRIRVKSFCRVGPILTMSAMPSSTLSRLQIERS